MASWRTSFWCRQDAETNPSTSTWYVQDLRSCQLFPRLKVSNMLVISWNLCVSTCKAACKAASAMVSNLILRIVEFQWYHDIPSSLCYVWLGLEDPHPALKRPLCICLFLFLTLSLSSSSVCDDFTESRNLKLSLGLQSVSEKPIKSSFKPFVLCVCVMHMYAGPCKWLYLASSLSVWHFVRDSSHSS